MSLLINKEMLKRIPDQYKHGIIFLNVELL
jgi:hypothetical protein